MSLSTGVHTRTAEWESQAGDGCIAARVDTLLTYGRATFPLQR